MNAFEWAVKRKRFHVAKFLLTSELIPVEVKSQFVHSYESIITQQCCGGFVSLALQKSQTSNLKQKTAHRQISVEKPSRIFRSQQRSESEPREAEFNDGVSKLQESNTKFQKLKTKSVTLQNYAELGSANFMEQTKNVDEVIWARNFLKENNLLELELRNSCRRITQKMILLDSSSNCPHIKADFDRLGEFLQVEKAAIVADYNCCQFTIVADRQFLVKNKVGELTKI